MKKVILFGALSLALALTGVANAQLSIVDNLPGTWIDISGSGTALNLSDDGEVDIATAIGNAVLGGGTARVGSNGAVRFFGTGTDLSFINAAIPSASNFALDSQVLDVFWDDINTSSGTNGNIFWEEVNGGDTLVVSWVDAGFFGSTDTVTFQLQVHNTGTGTGFAQFLYRDVTSARANLGAGATIGYQDGSGGVFNDAQWSFDTPSVDNGVILTLVPEPASLILLGLGGLALIRRR